MRITVPGLCWDRIGTDFVAGVRDRFISALTPVTVALLFLSGAAVCAAGLGFSAVWPVTGGYAVGGVVCGVSWGAVVVSVGGVGVGLWIVSWWMSMPMG